jgi:hypothetical protein
LAVRRGNGTETWPGAPTAGTEKAPGGVALAGGSEFDATLAVLFVLEAGFVLWLAFRGRRGAPSRVVDDAVRLGLRAARRRA